MNFNFNPFNFSAFSILDITFWGIIFFILLIALKYSIYLWAEKKRARDMLFIEIKIPKQDSKEDGEKVGNEYGSGKDFIKIASAMTQLYASLFSISSGTMWNKYIVGQEYFVCEYFVEKGLIKFIMGFSPGDMNTSMKQISAIYPDAVMDFVDRPNVAKDRKFFMSGHLYFGDSYIMPLKKMELMTADPINTVINAFSKVHPDDRAGLQILMRPDLSNWHDKGIEKAERMYKDEDDKKGGSLLFAPFRFIGTVLRILINGAENEEFTAQNMDQQGMVQTTPVMQERVKAIEEKAIKQGFDVIIRGLSASDTSQEKAFEYWKDLKNAFSIYESADLNSFSTAYNYSKSWIKKHYWKRSFSHPFWHWGWRFLFSGNYEWKQIFSTEELASVFHLPSVQYNPSPAINWQGFKVTPPPVDMPQKGLLLGINEYRGETTEVRIKPDDRMRHFYLIGKSGTGKSTLLEQMIRQDMENGNGLCLVDPHGDLVEAVLPYLPRERAEDVIVFDPGDLDRPMGVNILEAKTDDQKEFMAQEALAIFIKLYGEEVMGPRLQNYFRNGVLTLMADDDDQATLLDIMRLFTDDAYSKVKQEKVTNAAVRAFWEQEYAKSGDREKQEIIPYFAAKFGPFVTNSQIRNIIGQGKSGFDFRDVMDNKKILLVNLSKGKLGDLNAKLLGMIFVAKIQMAAMSRVDTPEEDREDFFLYVDEFQNFVTESFASILSEARKYRLGLIVAHQYISQITKMNVGGKGSQEDHTIKDAVFGNVGSMMNFKIGAQDAEAMVKEFQPVFSETDLINIANYHAVIKLNIDNTTSRGFVMKTIYDTSGADNEAAEAYAQLSRLKYARDRSFVEREIKRKLVGSASNSLPGMDQAFQTPIF